MPDDAWDWSWDAHCRKQKSLSKVNNKSDKKEKIKHDIKIENQQLIDEIHQIMANTYVEIEKVKKLEMKEN